MKCLVRFCILMVWPVLLSGQQPGKSAPASARYVMVAAVTRNDADLTGGIGVGRTYRGVKLHVMPIAWLQSDGAWKSTGCDADNLNGCDSFNRKYLIKSHTFEVVSADGYGAKVSVPTMKLYGECLEYGGFGVLTGQLVRDTAIAAEAPGMFVRGDPAKRLTDAEAEPIRKALSRAVGDKLDAMRKLKVYKATLEGQELIFIQRAYQDYALDPKEDTGMEHLKFIFAVGKMKDGRFELLHWKEDIEDDNEQILGLVHLQNGRDFLVTTTSDPETQHFRVYGIRKGRLAIVFEGGGGGC